MNTLFASNRPATRSASTLRFSTVASLAGVFALSLAGTAANAQTYVGDAYVVGTNVGVGLLNVANLGVAATVSDTGNLPSSGGALSQQILGAGLNVTADAGLFNVASVSGNPAANTQVAAASTAGNGGGVPAGNVSSTSFIDNADIFSGLLTASVISSTTTATYASSALTGTSLITGLKLDGIAINFSSAVANTSSVIEVDTGTVGPITIGTGPNQQIALVTVGLFGSKTVDATLTTNEQIYNAANDVLTTNAIDLDVNTDVLSALGVNGKVVVASSTAGFLGGGTAAAPEPGSVTMIAAGLPFLLGGIGVRRRRMAKRQGSAA